MTNPNKNGLVWLKTSLDPNGRLFSLNDKLYRSMRGFDLTYYQRLLKTITANPILDSHMVRTTISTEAINGLPFVLEHETIHPTTYPYEWSTMMFKDAALCHCDVHIELAKSGFNLQDAHPWNVLFRHTTPVFVDYGSVIKDNSFRRRQALLKEYTSFMIYPLYLMSKLESAKARRYLTHSDPPLDLRDLLGYFSFRDALNNIVKITSSRIHSSNNLVKMLIAIRKHIDSLPLQSSSPWLGYHDDEFQRTENDWHDKQRNIYKILRRVNPKTVLDLGCATGWYAGIAAKLGIKVTALDVDDVIVNHTYKLGAATNLPITPLRRARALDDAIRLFCTLKAPSIVSVVRCAKRLVQMRYVRDGVLVPIIDLANLNVQRQECETLFAVNGAIYLASPVTLETFRTFHVPGAMAFEMEPSHSVDIDTIHDLELAEYYIYRGEGNTSLCP